MVTKPGGDLDVSGVHHGQTIDMTGKNGNCFNDLHLVRKCVGDHSDATA
jgi:hypothetical protein